MNFILKPFIHFILLFATLALIESFFVLVFFSATHINSVFVKSLIDTLILTAISTPLIYFLFVRLIMKKREKTYKTLMSNKKLITELLENQKELETNLNAVNGTSDMILITDTEGKIIYANPSFTHNTGYSLDEVQDKNARILKSGMHDRNFFESFWNTLLNGKTWAGKITNRKKDGSLYFSDMSVTPIYDLSGKIFRFVSISRDITEKQKAEEKMKQMEEQFNQTQKMDAIGRLAGGVAHDFNNLLTGIIGYCELLSDKMEKGSEEQKYLNEVIQSSQKASDLARQLLIFSRKQHLDKKVNHLNNIIQGLSSMLKQVLGEDIELIEQLDNNVSPVLIDKGQMEQVIMNLAINARDAMPGGGKLNIKTEMVELGLNDVQKLDLELKPGIYIKLTVQDNGIGMDKGVMEHIFEPFYSTKGKGKGAGMGLSTVYGTVKQSDGAIEIRSELNKGSTFLIYLPETKLQEKENEAEITNMGPELPAGKQTILIIEDDSFLLYSLVKVLQRKGYHTLISTNSDEALEVTKNFPNSIDIILMDVVLPKKNGIEVAQMLKKECPGAKILYISGYSDKEVIKSQIIDKGLPFLQKPFNPDKLLNAIRNLSADQSKAA